MTAAHAVPDPGGGHETLRDRLLAAHAEAADFFASRLRSESDAGPRGYLNRRGFGAVIDSPVWRVGYAPPRWTDLTDHLRQTGFRDTEICASGLGLRTRRGTVVDRFRDRITFGVRDEHGHVVGFLGRAAPGAGGVPKYLNSPRSMTYEKSAVLFGLGDQHSQLVSGGVPVLVEGPLDAMAVSLASKISRPLVGIAACGTALTPTQVQALAMVSTGPVLVAFDADAAGMAAVVRSYATVARSSSLAAQAVRLPLGTDPASVLADRGIAGLRAALAKTVPLADLVVDQVLSQYAHRLDNAEARLCALREIASTIAVLPRGDVAGQAARLGSLLDFDHRTVARELAEAVSLARFRPQPNTGRRNPQIDRPAGGPHLASGELESRTAGGRA
jgi:DNA primase catalytic core